MAEARPGGPATPSGSSSGSFSSSRSSSASNSWSPSLSRSRSRFRCRSNSHSTSSRSASGSSLSRSPAPQRRRSSGDMSSGSGSRIRRSRNVDNPVQSQPSDSIPSSSQSAPILSASSAASTSTLVALTWGRRTGRRGPTRCVTERRLEPGQRVRVTLIGGYAVGLHSSDFATRLGATIRMHCKIWQKNLAALPEETKDAIFRDMEAVYEWERTPQADKDMMKHMTSMMKGWRGMIKDKHYKDKTLEGAIASVPPGVDPNDWQTMCQMWNTGEEQEISRRNSANRSQQSMTYRRGRTSLYQLKDDFEKTYHRTTDRMEVFKMGRCKHLPDGSEKWVDDESSSAYEKMMQLTQPDLASDAHTTPVSAEDAFKAVMGPDRLGRVRCAGRAETLGSWYSDRLGAGSSSGSYRDKVHTLEQKVEEQSKLIDEMTAQRSEDRRELNAMRAQRSEDRQELNAMRKQMEFFMRHFPRSAAPEDDDGGDDDDA